MFIRIETSSGVPITRQIADQIRTLCAIGELAPQDRLPSVRVLARDLAVNQNTILRVYERLTTEGLLERRHGDGTYVTRNIRPDQLQVQQEQLNRQIDNLIHYAHTLGLDQSALIDRIKRTFQKQVQQNAPSESSDKQEENPT